MATLPELSQWDGVYQIETTDPVLGGANGLSNTPLKNLVNRTKYLADTKAPLASPALTGTPTAPTADGGTNTTQLATTAFVAAAVTAGAVAVAGGTADAITAAYTPAITALTNGMTLYARAGAANTSTTPTFAPNGLAAKTIVKGAGAALVAGDIAGGGHWIGLQYDSTLGKWVLLNPYSYASVEITRDGTVTTQAVTPAGLAASVIGIGQTWQDMTASRTLNTTYVNTTGKAIAVSAVAVFTGSNDITITVGGLLLTYERVADSGTSSGWGAVMGIIPDGATYMVGKTTAATFTSLLWRELR